MSTDRHGRARTNTDGHGPGTGRHGPETPASHLAAALGHLREARVGMTRATDAQREFCDHAVGLVEMLILGSELENRKPTTKRPRK